LHGSRKVNYRNLKLVHPQGLASAAEADHS
jgi:hypothetical protein